MEATRSTCITMRALMRRGTTGAESRRSSGAGGTRTRSSRCASMAAGRIGLFRSGARTPGARRSRTSSWWGHTRRGEFWFGVTAGRRSLSVSSARGAPMPGSNRASSGIAVPGRVLRRDLRPCPRKRCPGGMSLVKAARMPLLR